MNPLRLFSSETLVRELARRVEPVDVLLESGGRAQFRLLPTVDVSVPPPPPLRWSPENPQPASPYSQAGFVAEPGQVSVEDVIEQAESRRRRQRRTTESDASSGRDPRESRDT